MDRTTLRRSVMAELGDLRLLTATDDGTTTTFIDAVNLYGEPGHYAGRLAYVSGGTPANLGLTRPVRGSSQNDSSITFSHPLPEATATGDEIELVNTFGMGWTFEDVHAAINMTIREARGYARVPLVADSADAFDEAGTRTIPIPESFVGISRVLMLEASTNHEINVRRANHYGANGWAIDRANRTVLINGERAGAAHNRTIRLIGYGEPEPMESDSDTTALDPEWLHLKTCSRMLLNVIRSRQGADWQGQGLYYADKADRLKSRLTPNFEPSYVEI